tara:strand:- start:8511 stop:9875 length:1365 start_codon:yes stop_codon:yes gene_type:complete
MAAIVTQNFRLRAAKQFVADLTEAANNYYLFVGRSATWTDDTTPDAPYDNTHSHTTDVWQHMMSLKKLATTDLQFAAPRYQWISGTTYNEYDDRDTTLESKKFYVITDNNHIMLCLKAGPGASTTNPDNSGVTTAGVIDFSASDGYIWKYLYTLSTTAANKFLTSAFIPMDDITSNPGGAAAQALQDQWAVKQAAIDGAIYNIKVINGGTGYSASDTFTVTITGDGASAAVVDANVTVAGGVITKLLVSTPGTGYSKAKVVITSDGSGSGATARAIIGPKNGFGYDARQDMRGHYITINASLTGNENDTFITGNEFRQLGIVRNPYNFGTTTVSTGGSLRATYSLTLSGPPAAGEFLNDSVIVGSSSAALGVVDDYDATNGIVYYHQNETTGFGTFTVSDNVKINGTSNTARNVTAVGNPGVEHGSGEVIFVENRTAVNRADDQIETVKLVLEF